MGKTPAKPRARSKPKQADVADALERLLNKTSGYLEVPGLGTFAYGDLMYTDAATAARLKADSSIRVSAAPKES